MPDFLDTLTLRGQPLVPVVRSVNTSAPLTGGGDLSADRTLGLAFDSSLELAGSLLRVRGLGVTADLQVLVAGSTGAASNGAQLQVQAPTNNTGAQIQTWAATDAGASKLRSTLNNRGSQSWYVSDGSSEVGAVSVSGAAGAPAIYFQTALGAWVAEFRHLVANGVGWFTAETANAGQAERMRLTGLGNLLLGLTTDNGGRLEVQSSANNTGANIQAWRSSTTLRSSLNDRGGQAWYLNSGTAEVGSINYTTPSGRAGIVFFDELAQGRTDIRHIGNNGGLSVWSAVAGGAQARRFTVDGLGDNFLFGALGIANATRGFHQPKLQLFSSNAAAGASQPMVELISTGWSAASALLFNAYSTGSNNSIFNPGGGNIKHSMDANGTNNRAGGIYFIGNGGLMDFYIGPPSTANGDSVIWPTQQMRITTTSVLIGKTSGLATAGDLDVAGRINTDGGLIQDAFTAPTLASGFSNYSNGFATVGWYKGAEGRIYLKGMMSRTAIATATAFGVGSTNAPAAKLLFTTQSNAGLARVDVDTSGNVGVITPGANVAITWISLDGISWRPGA